MAADLWDLSDAELEAAFREAKGQDNSPDTAYEESYNNDYTDNDNDDIEVDNLEQPYEDSDDDTGSDDDTDDLNTNASDTNESEVDEHTDNVDENTDVDDDDVEEIQEQPTQEILRFRANGQDYSFTPEEMRAQFGRIFGQAMDYTKKMQQIKPWRQTIDALEQANIKQDDLNLMIDVLKGDKGAIQQVLKRTGIDALDIDAEDNTNYVTKNYGRSETELAIKDIVDEISVDREYNITHNVLDKQWDESSRMEFVKDPVKIKQLHIDVKTGMFDIINPVAQKMKVYDGGRKSDIEYYKLASQQYFDEHAQYEARAQAAEEIRQSNAIRLAEAQRIAEVKANQAKQDATRQASDKRKAAAPTRSNAGTKKIIDYLDDSDEAYEDWYKSKVMDKL